MKIKITDIVLPEGSNYETYDLAIQLLKSSEYPGLTVDQIYELVEKLLTIKPLHIEYKEVE